MDLYDGRLRAIDSNGVKLLDQVAPGSYLEVLAEEVRPWSYMKFPYLRQLGAADGWFRVGPLARVNVCDFAGTPRADAELREFRRLAPRLQRGKAAQRTRLHDAGRVRRPSSGEFTR